VATIGEIAVFNVGGNYFAFFNRCPHAWLFALRIAAGR
jgi:nitrite reductase/ring-hydroxylating ferredoxin subunit